MVLVVSSKLSAEKTLNYCEGSFRAALKLFADTHSVPSRWVIAHSGGLDSQLLLALAVRCLPLDKLCVLHINHHLQPIADQWAQFSAQQATAYRLPQVTVDVLPANSSEVAAREARYDAFSGFLKEGDCLLLGHHADDQAETLLYRWLRGAGLRGTGGMRASRQLAAGHLLRPLLNCSRAELEQAAAALQLDWVQDPSNQRSEYDRNYLRHRVVPALEARWPQFQKRWQKSAEVLQGTDDLLNDYLDRDLEAFANGNCLALKPLASFDGNKRDALLRRWVEKLTGQLLNSTQLRQIYQDLMLARVDSSPVFVFSAGELRRYRDKLYFCSGIENTANMETIALDQAGEYDLGDGVLRIYAEKEGVGFDSKGLSLCRRSGGEKIAPYGQTIHKRVKKLLQDAGIPPWVRANWPLIYCGDQLVAVPGVCVSDQWLTQNPDFSILWCSNSLSDNC